MILVTNIINLGSCGDVLREAVCPSSALSRGVGAQLRDRRVELAASAFEQKLGQMRREVVGKAWLRQSQAAG